MEGLTDFVRGSWPTLVVLVLLTVLGSFLPMVIDDRFVFAVLLQGLVIGIAAAGLGFLAYQCGLVMFGAAAFIGLPAYVVAIAVMTLGWSLAAAILLAMFVTTVFAAFVGALIVRARPLPFCMLTLALAQMLRSVAALQLLRPWTGGDDGLPLTFRDAVFGLSQSNLALPGKFWPIAWLTLCGVLFLLWGVSRSRLGQVLRAIRANEERMRFSGFDTFLPRLAAFTLSCFVIGLSGVLIVLNAAFVSPDLLDFAAGGDPLVAMLVGGPNAVIGPALGAMVYVWAQSIFGAIGHLELLTGIAMVLAISFFPKGLVGFVQWVWAWCGSRVKSRRKKAA